jgi:hypothetical protein
MGCTGRQPAAPAGCRVVAHRKFTGVDDVYNARAANRKSAPAGCWVLTHWELAGVDDLYTALAAKFAAPTGSWLQPAAGR